MFAGVRNVRARNATALVPAGEPGQLWEVRKLLATLNSALGVRQTVGRAASAAPCWLAPVYYHLTVILS